MRSPTAYLKERIYEFFEVGSLESLHEQIRDSKSDATAMGELVRKASYDFGLEQPDEQTQAKITSVFGKVSDGWTDDIRKQVADFACWSRKMMLVLGEKDSPAISLPNLVKRIEANLDKRSFGEQKTDRILTRMSRAGEAMWEWFGNLEADGIEYMGKLVTLPREQALSYMPEKYVDVSDITTATIDMMLEQKELYFNYWKGKKAGPGGFSGPDLR